MLSTTLLAVVISGAVEHVGEVGCGPGTFRGGGNQGGTLRCLCAAGVRGGGSDRHGGGGSDRGGGGGGCSCSGGAAMLFILTGPGPAVHQLGVVAVVVGEVEEEVVLALGQSTVSQVRPGW